MDRAGFFPARAGYGLGGLGSCGRELLTFDLGLFRAHGLNPRAFSGPAKKTIFERFCAFKIGFSPSKEPVVTKFRKILG